MYERVSVQNFMDAWFFEDYSKLTKEDFEIVYSEYIDTVGLFVTAEFDLVCYIRYLTNRVNTVKVFVASEKQHLEFFNEPYIEDFSWFSKKFGYKLKWNGDKLQFIEQLDKVLKKDHKFQIELNAKEKKLEEERKKAEGSNKPKGKKEIRVDFIKMLNTLSKIGFYIDRTTTTVEDISLMVKQQTEEAEEIKLKSEYAGRK